MLVASHPKQEAAHFKRACAEGGAAPHRHQGRGQTRSGEGQTRPKGSLPGRPTAAGATVAPLVGGTDGAAGRSAGWTTSPFLRAAVFRPANSEGAMSSTSFSAKR